MTILSQHPWLGYLEQLNALISAFGHIKLLVAGAGIYAAYSVLYAFYLSPLCNIPGPLLARLFKSRYAAYGLTGGVARISLEDYEKYGDVYVLKPNAISISKLSDIRAVLGTHSFVKSDYYKNHGLNGQTTTLSASEPQFAKMRRRQIGPYFSSSYLSKMEGAIVKHGIVSIKDKWDEMLKESENGQVEINYHKTYLYATFDTISSLAFGRELGALKNDDPTMANWLKATMAYLAVKLMFRPLTLYPFSLLLSDRKRQYDELINHAADCIAERKKLLADLEAKDNGDLMKPADLLQAFIDAQDPESKIKMTPMEVHAESLLMLIAGSETSSNTLMWTTHLFMLYPECYKKAVEEVRTQFDRDHLITYSEAKAKLPYLEACIYESMRISPAAGAQIPRVVPKEGVVLSSGHFIPGGTEININMPGVCYNKELWENPYHYNPTRFIDNEEAKRNALGFSYGVRVCPGKQLAWIEIFTILANVLKDYDLRAPDGCTDYGPSVLSDKGYPRIMDEKYYVTRAPANIERDCRVVVTKRRQE